MTARRYFSVAFRVARAERREDPVGWERLRGDLRVYLYDVEQLLPQENTIRLVRIKNPDNPTEAGRPPKVSLNPTRLRARTP